MLHLSEREALQVGLVSPVQVRKLGHIVLWVRDVERSKQFYTEILNFRVSDVNEKGMVFLTACGDHHTIAIAQTQADDAGPKGRPGLHHFAMEVESVDQLFAIREFMRRKGVQVAYEGRRGPGSNVGIEFSDPDGNTVELYADMDQIAAGESSRPASQWSRTATLEEACQRPRPTGR